MARPVPEEAVIHDGDVVHGAPPLANKLGAGFEASRGLCDLPPGSAEFLVGDRVKGPGGGLGKAGEGCGLDPVGQGQR
jgi:hypothetical protein